MLKPKNSSEMESININELQKKQKEKKNIKKVWFEHPSEFDFYDNDVV